MIYSETPRRKQVTKLVSWGHWFALVNMIIAILLAGIYFLGSPMPWTPTGSIYLFLNWFGHIGFLVFIGFVILILPLCYLIPKPKLVKALGAVIAALGIALLVFDALLYNRHGLHLSLGSAQLIQAETQVVVEQFGKQHWVFLLILFAAWLAFQLIIANAIWQRLERFQKRHIGMQVSSFFVGCFVLSHAMHIWADAKLYQPILIQDDIFPLSYPATAKTLMSRYGLLDRETYQQRKQLQFGSKVEMVNYPSEPVYCTVGFDSQSILAILTDAAHEFSFEGLNKQADHYGFASSEQAQILSTLYGLPEMYLKALTTHKPLLMDIPDRLGLEVSLYWDSKAIPTAIQPFQADWQQVKAALAQDKGRLLVLVLNRSQLDELAAIPGWLQNNILITSLADSESNLSGLFSNLPLQPQISTQEDLVPTLLASMGCQAQARSHSTGKNLLTGARNWVISTNQNNVFVMHNGRRIEINSNGGYKIMQRESLEVVNEDLDTNLLSQAMKHLSRFGN